LDRASRVSIGIVSFILALVILASVGGFVYVIKMASEYYSQEILDEIKKKTADAEGYCLTDIVKEDGLEYDGLPYVYDDACVSIYSINKSKAAGSTMLGSGVCVASKDYVYNGETALVSGSYIVTNYHVIENIISYYKIGNKEMYQIQVFPNDYTNFERYGIEDITYDADLLWYDSYLDQAIIYVEENIDWVRMKDRSIDCEESESLKKGEKAFVIGTPVQIENQNTVTKGTINSSDTVYTATASDRGEMANIYEYLIPMQISINNGNSGGGLFDKDGYLVGQPTLGTTNSTAAGAINYAIPIYSAMLVLDKIIIANEANTAVKIYNLNGTQFVGIDKEEFDIMNTFGFEYAIGGNYKFYGIYCTKDEMRMNDTGFKVVYTKTLTINKYDVISEIKIGEATYTIDCRNDLIFALLRYNGTDTIQYKIGETYVEGNIA